MNGDVNKLKKVNDDLLFLNKTLSNAEMIAGFGSWKVNVFKNTYHFSDNFYRLIGVMPNEFDAELNNVMDYIHPEDREEVLKQHKESFVTEKNSTIVYRYLLSDGTIKHMESVGKFMHNAKGELVKIGVNRDVTELMKKSTELEEKNEKLISINSELESFNNIVGHDLQEPLRKIQMFISRIESNEFKETASETTVLYFEKIKTSAQRMQNLMTDLVDYTRTIKGDRIFERIDLNLILEEIIDELSSTIEEKNAIITVDNLPSIVGTRFQIQQLFTNLISNSLKYLTPYVTPIIRVQLENFNKEVVNDKFIFGKDYYKITVTDNGIGFEQKYADIIFMLFKRLATDLSYEGTGLGLAICKKIVDSNNGLITANGVPNVGSIFSIYLPKNNTVKR
jgi:PAS domain S-box-containing protein